MSHTVEIIDHKELPSGEHAVLARCCGSDVHKSWHTMAACVVNDEAKCQESLNWLFNRVAVEHQIALDGAAKLKSVVGTSVQAKSHSLTQTQ